MFFVISCCGFFQAICAKANDEPCCDWVGEDGAGHFVKMVHNGIEYGDMQLICEAYHLMKDVLGYYFYSTSISLSYRPNHVLACT